MDMVLKPNLLQLSPKLVHKNIKHNTIITMQRIINFELREEGEILLFM